MEPNQPIHIYSLESDIKSHSRPHDSQSWQISDAGKHKHHRRTMTNTNNINSKPWVWNSSFCEYNPKRRQYYATNKRIFSQCPTRPEVKSGIWISGPDRVWRTRFIVANHLKSRLMYYKSKSWKISFESFTAHRMYTWIYNTAYMRQNLQMD